MIATTSPLSVGDLGYAADDSIDFHARHGRALHARAAWETIALLVRALRSPNRPGAGGRSAWHDPWPTTPRAAPCGQR